jgi:hypothetical protein
MEAERWLHSILGNLYPYIAQRMSGNSSLPREELPIPAPLKGVFDDWANRKLNFISSSQSAKR